MARCSKGDRLSYVDERFNENERYNQTEADGEPAHLDEEYLERTGLARSGFSDCFPHLRKLSEKIEICPLNKLFSQAAVSAFLGSC